MAKRALKDWQLEKDIIDKQNKGINKESIIFRYKSYNIFFGFEDKLLNITPSQFTYHTNSCIDSERISDEAKKMLNTLIRYDTVGYLSYKILEKSHKLYDIEFNEECGVTVDIDDDNNEANFGCTTECVTNVPYLFCNLRKYGKVIMHADDQNDKNFEPVDFEDETYIDNKVYKPPVPKIYDNDHNICMEFELEDVSYEFYICYRSDGEDVENAFADIYNIVSKM